MTEMNLISRKLIQNTAISITCSLWKRVVNSCNYFWTIVRRLFSRFFLTLSQSTNVENTVSSTCHVKYQCLRFSSITGYSSSYFYLLDIDERYRVSTPPRSHIHSLSKFVKLLPLAAQWRNIHMRPPTNHRNISKCILFTLLVNLMFLPIGGMSRQTLRMQFYKLLRIYHTL